MAQKNTLQPLQQNQEQPKTFSRWLAKVENQTSITSMIGNPTEASKFIGNISSAVAVNPQLQGCSFPTVVSAGLLANALKLSLSPSIGHCYLVPFDDKKNNRTVATFILGWKGYLQLAQRSGYYEQLNVVEIKEGEVEKIDTINEIYKFSPIEDDEEREKKPTIGYYAYFRYNEAHGGFFKAMYWSKKKMLAHADKYSKAFNAKSYEDLLTGKIAEKDMWKYSSFWYKSFDEMAKKTMLRQLIGKWGIMSVEFQKAYESDGSFSEDMTDSTPREYSESDSNIILNPQDVAEEKTTTSDAEEKQAENAEKVAEDFFDENND